MHLINRLSEPGGIKYIRVSSEKVTVGLRRGDSKLVYVRSYENDLGGMSSNDIK